VSAPEPTVESIREALASVRPKRVVVVHPDRETVVREAFDGLPEHLTDNVRIVTNRHVPTVDTALVMLDPEDEFRRPWMFPLLLEPIDSPPSL
jgi:hypothetical protein